MSKSLKLYDSQLNQKTEALKTELSIYAHEQNVSLSRVDAQRADAIQKVYSAMREWVNHATKICTGSNIVNAFEQQELDFYFDQGDAAHAAAVEFAKILSDNAIFFDIDLYTKLSEFSNVSGISTAVFLRTIRKGNAEGAPVEQLLHYVESDRKKFQESFDKSIETMIQELTEQFRIQLGFIRGEKA